MLVESNCREFEMRELPGDAAFKHGVEASAFDIRIRGGVAFGRVEGAAHAIPRQVRAGARVQPLETIQPVQAVAVQRAAHIEQNRVEHDPFAAYHSAARNRRSARDWGTHSIFSAIFIATATIMKKPSTRCAHASTPTA